MNNLLPMCFWLMTQLSGGSTSLDTLSKARMLYEEGDFDNTAIISRQVNTAEGYSLAARANLMKAHYLARGKDKIKLLNQVINDVNKTLQLEPENLDAHLQMAMALGLLADMNNPLTVYFRGYARKGRNYLLQAMKLAPDDPWVNGLLGMWHLQIVKKSTAFVGNHLFNATIKDGIYYCNRAEELSKNELYILYGCAVSLYEINRKLYKDRVCKTLGFVAAKQPSSIEETFVIKDAKRLLEEKHLIDR